MQWIERAVCVCVRESVSAHLQPIAHNFTYLLNHISSTTSPTVAEPDFFFFTLYFPKDLINLSSQEMCTVGLLFPLYPDCRFLSEGLVLSSQFGVNPVKLSPCINSTLLS